MVMGHRDGCTAQCHVTAEETGQPLAPPTKNPLENEVGEDTLHTRSCTVYLFVLERSVREALTSEARPAGLCSTGAKLGICYNKTSQLKNTFPR